MRRIQVFYEGRVQGVGFRMTARRLAAGLPVVGFVRNLDDGRVELVAEGEPAVLADLLRRIDAQFGAGIAGRREVPLAVGDPPLAGFSIR